MIFTNIQLGSTTAPGSAFTANRFIDANSFKLVINGSGTSIFEMTNGVNRRFAFGSNGQYTMDAYGVGAFTGTAAKWLAVTAAGVVIEEAPPTSGGGSVTSFSFTDANGFDGTVTNPTTTPNLTLTTTLTQGSVFFAGSGGAIAEDNSNFFFDNTNNVLGLGVNSGFEATRLNVVDNAVGAANIVYIESTSTAAASNLQVALRVALSGANATSGQSTWCVHVHNSHTGTTGTNIGIDSTASGGASNNTAYQATTHTNGSFNYGFRATIQGSNSSATNFGFRAEVTTSGTFTISYGIRTDVSGTSATNYGGYFNVTNGTNNYAIVVPSGGGRVGIGTITPSAQALLELASTTQAFLIMRMTATQASAITAADGMLLYVTDTNATFTAVGVWARENGAWVKL